MLYHLRHWMIRVGGPDLADDLMPAYLMMVGLFGIAVIVFAPARYLSSSYRAEPALFQIATIYRRMGWIGIICYVTLCSIMFQGALKEPRPSGGEFLAMAGLIGLIAAFFATMLWTANRLESDFLRTYRVARWTGILVAVLYFPWLTIPGCLAVRRLAQYRRGLEMNLNRVDSGSIPAPCDS
jgi:hypothetical protein